MKNNEISIKVEAKEKINFKFSVFSYGSSTSMV